jgi:probable phosphoglycerate mutase
MNISVYTDGGSRGNPGISGYGLVIYDDNKKILFQESKYLGVKTNNEAEYSGLVGALEWIEKNKDSLKISQINFFSDSQLMIRQLQGIYKVKAPNLKPLFDKSKKIIDLIKVPISFKDVRREFNELADELANQAMDHKL